MASVTHNPTISEGLSALFQANTLNPPSPESSLARGGSWVAQGDRFSLGEATPFWTASAQPGANRFGNVEQYAYVAGQRGVANPSLKELAGTGQILSGADFLLGANPIHGTHPGTLG